MITKNGQQTIKVQDQDGTFYEVSFSNWNCTCGDFAKLADCVHAQLAKDIHLFRGRRYRWLIYSAFHKEVRRSDLELGMQWAKIVQIISGPNGLLNYCRKILFEETRNLELHEEINTAFAPVPLEIARKLILSKKKWELKCLPDHTFNWAQAYEQFKRTPHLFREAGEITTVIEAYQHWFQFKHNKDQRPEFFSKMLEVAKQKNNTILQNYLKRAGGTGYEYMVSIELLLNILDSTQINILNEFTNPLPKESIPRFEQYIYDIHTKYGAKKLIENLDHFKSDMPLGHTGLDLRFSGSIVSLAKRELNYQLNGDKLNWNWDKVKLEKEKLSLIIKLEQFFYKKLK